MIDLSCWPNSAGGSGRFRWIPAAGGGFPTAGFFVRYVRFSGRSCCRQIAPRGFVASGPGGAEGERKASASVLRGNCRQHVDRHRLRIGLARELQRVAVINLMERRLMRFDCFLEARGRIGDLVR